ncbi:MAG: phosphorylase [Sphingomonas bacterium]
MRLIVACGLKREARIITRACPDAVAVIGGGVAAQLEARLEAAANGFAGVLLSCGIAGALSPELKAGDVVIDGDGAALATLRCALPDAVVGRIVGGDAILASAAAKRALRDATGGVAVDMESHVAMRVARRHGLPFAAVRVISDGAADDLPPAALVGMRPDGGMALGAVLASLARNPRQLAALIHTGRQADRAFAGLKSAMEAVSRITD